MLVITIISDINRPMDFFKLKKVRDGADLVKFGLFHFVLSSLIVWILFIMALYANLDDGIYVNLNYASFNDSIGLYALYDFFLALMILSAKNRLQDLRFFAIPVGIFFLSLLSGYLGLILAVLLTMIPVAPTHYRSRLKQ